MIMSLCIGNINISIIEIINVFSNENNTFRKIILDIRLPRLLNAFLVGISLSVSGLILQTFLRNNLAETGILGISAGAGLGAIIVFILTTSISISFLNLISFTFAFSTTLLIFFIAKGLNRKYETYFSVNKIILSGIAINALLSAVNALLLIVAGNDLTQIIYWMNGGLNGRGWEEFKNVIVFVIIGLTISLLILKNLKIINIGDEIASSLGINLKVTQILAVIACSLLASSAVAVAGIISFIGLIIPNIIRLILGSDLKFNFAGAVLLGPVFMIISDLIARTVISPSELPVGIVTAFIGAPVFVWLILKSKNI